MSNKFLIDKTLSSLEYCLKGRDDFFITTSFGYQSSLLFFLFSEIGISPKCLYIASDLAYGGIDEQKDYISKKFDASFELIDRNKWLHETLKGDDFLLLSEDKKRTICRGLKRNPLLEFIKNNSMKIWISGIRKDQTKSRESIQFLEVTDLNVIKISPLFEWTTDDITKIIKSNKLKVNIDYTDLCKLNNARECGLHF